MHRKPDFAVKLHCGEFFFAFLVQFFEESEDFFLDNYAVAVVGDKYVAESVDAFLVQFAVAHHEAAPVVVSGAAGDIMVECAAGGDDDVD